MSVDPDVVPNLNKEGVFQYLTEQGYIVTRWAVKMAVINHRISRHSISGRLLFSRKNARAWIDSLEQPAEQHAPESVAVNR
jgi:hypothetical protein